MRNTKFLKTEIIFVLQKMFGRNTEEKLKISTTALKARAQDEFLIWGILFYNDTEKCKNIIR